MQTTELLNTIEAVLDDHKGQYITTLNVTDKTSVTDYMVLVTATSERHANALCDYVMEKTKQHDIVAVGIEGRQNSDWVLLDLGDVVLHIMTAQAREFYQLEKLWSINPIEETIE